MKSAARQTSNKARSGLVFCRCGAAFVSPREGSAVSWLVSSTGWRKTQGELLFMAQIAFMQNASQTKHSESLAVFLIGTNVKSAVFVFGLKFGTFCNMNI